MPRALRPASRASGRARATMRASPHVARRMGSFLFKVARSIRTHRRRDLFFESAKHTRARLSQPTDGASVPVRRPRSAGRYDEPRAVGAASADGRDSAHHPVRTPRRSVRVSHFVCERVCSGTMREQQAQRVRQATITSQHSLQLVRSMGMGKGGRTEMKRKRESRLGRTPRRGVGADGNRDGGFFFFLWSTHPGALIRSRRAFGISVFFFPVAGPKAPQAGAARRCGLRSRGAHLMASSDWGGVWSESMRRSDERKDKDEDAKMPWVTQRGASFFLSFFSFLFPLISPHSFLSLCSLYTT